MREHWKYYSLAINHRNVLSHTVRIRGEIDAIPAKYFTMINTMSQVQTYKKYNFFIDWPLVSFTHGWPKGCYLWKQIVSFWEQTIFSVSQMDWFHCQNRWCVANVMISGKGPDRLAKNCIFNLYAVWGNLWCSTLSWLNTVWSKY